MPTWRHLLCKSYYKFIDDCIKLIPMCIHECDQDLVNAYRCVCIEGYIGTNCETDRDDCAPMPCQNGATCTVSRSDISLTFVACIQYTVTVTLFSFTCMHTGSLERLQLLLPSWIFWAPL